MYARDTALIATPIGMVELTAMGNVLHSIAIVAETVQEYVPADGVLGLAAVQLRGWFAGERTAFDLPLAPAATPRGAALRDGMIAIPHGDTLSYGALAGTLGSSARAIGQACVRNPFPIVVPCHRVLNADGTLGAYSAGDGPPTKSLLLDLERRISKRTMT